MKKQMRAEKLVRVGLYDLESVLGKGNFALVRLGVHKLTKVKVAVKIVDKQDLDGENLQKISREIDIMRRLGSHPHLIRLLQVMETESMIYMVMEYAANGEIFDHLVTNGRMAEDKACRFFTQILSAISYCHARGVVHRDLKAENLLLDADNNIKLADFGFSNYYTAGELLSTWCGSPPYAAPELFEGKQYVGPKADIWSLGVVLYVLVSGSLPFDGATLQDLRARVVGCQYRVPFFLSSDCEHLLRGLLVIDPDRRLPLQQIARHPWTVLHAAASPPIARLLEDIATSSGATALPDLEPINEPVVDHITRTVNVSHEAVIDCVQQNKCDDISAMYHMLVKHVQDAEREFLRQQKQAAALMPLAAASAFPSAGPPLSPTAMAPFFQGAAYGSSGGSGPSTPRGPMEIFNEDSQLSLDAHPAHVADSKLLSARRHTLGPAQTPVFLPTLNLPHGGEGHRDILPQTNLPFNLPLVSNQPPEKFSVKDPHLLKPPLPLAASGLHGRRASDGGAYYNQFPLTTAEAPPDIAGYEEVSCQQQEVAAAILRASLPESPRRRRTGLLTVLEPPEIDPDVVQEVESRMRNQSPLLVVDHAPVTFMPPPFGSSSLSPLPSPSKPGSTAGVRQRRTGLSTVMEVGKCVHKKEPLHLSTGPGYSPVRRPSDGSPQCRLPPTSALTAADSSLPSSSEASPWDVVAIQEEYRRLSLATSTFYDPGGMSSGGFLSPNYLQTAGVLPRRSSDSGVNMQDRQQQTLRTSSSTHSATSEPLQRLYDAMYNNQQVPPAPAVAASAAMSTATGPTSRRFSYPNSPVRHQMLASSTSVSPPPDTQQHDIMCLQQQQLQQCNTSRFKGSITQGVPSRSATTPTRLLSRGQSLKAYTSKTLLESTPMGVSVSSSEVAPPQWATGLLVHSRSFDDAFDKDKHLGGGRRCDLERHYSVCEDLPMDAFQQNNPAIFVTNDHGDKVNLSESMDESC